MSNADAPINRKILGNEVSVRVNKLGNNYEVSVTHGIIGSIFPVGELFQIN